MSEDLESVPAGCPRQIPQEEWLLQSGAGKMYTDKQLEEARDFDQLLLDEEEERQWRLQREKQEEEEEQRFEEEQQHLQVQERLGVPERAVKRRFTLLLEASSSSTGRPRVTHTLVFVNGEAPGLYSACFNGV